VPENDVAYARQDGGKGRGAEAAAVRIGCLYSVDDELSLIRREDELRQCLQIRRRRLLVVILEALDFIDERIARFDVGLLNVLKYEWPEIVLLYAILPVYPVLVPPRNT
jgi:hypothetical protein